MPTVTANPLPVGRYWSDLIGENAIWRWLEWRKNVAAERVEIVNSVHHEAEGASPEREFVLYEVRTPTFYDHSFYAPVNSGDGINGEEDTVSKPDVNDLDLFPDFSGVTRGFEALATGLAVTIGVVSVAAIGIAAFRSGRSRT